MICEKHQSIWHLHRTHGLSQNEISRRTGIPRKTVGYGIRRVDEATKDMAFAIPVSDTNNAMLQDYLREKWLAEPRTDLSFRFRVKSALNNELVSASEIAGRVGVSDTAPTRRVLDALVAKGEAHSEIIRGIAKFSKVPEQTPTQPAQQGA